MVSKRKLLCLAALLCAAMGIVASVSAQSMMVTDTITRTRLEESGTSLVLMTSAFTDSKFEDFSGGLKLGGILPFDDGHTIFVRVIYSRINFGKNKEDLESLQGTMLMDWYLGSKWKFYATVGADKYLSGPNSGADFAAGVGLSRRIWTDQEPILSLIPASFDLYGELMLTDATKQETGTFVQLNVGLKFNKAGKK